MSLARVWRRQLCAASSAAVIVPCAILGALLVLALGGGFSQLGVLGQIFAGPPPPGAGPLAGAGSGATSAVPAALPVLPVPRRPTATVARRLAVAPAVRAPSHPAPGTAPRSGTGTGGGVLAPAPATLTHGSSPASGSAPFRPAPGSGPSSPAPSSPSPSPTGGTGSSGPPPSPPSTVVGPVIKVITSVTQQLPPPAGPTVTQAVQSAGSSVGGAPAPTTGLP